MKIIFQPELRSGFLSHQFLRRPCKEHFDKFKDSRPLAKEFNSVPEYGELQPTSGITAGGVLELRPPGGVSPLKLINFV